ncbi:MAG: PEP-CTERM system TPR-repeat protein PrsT [Aromatoleum sp.]|nr:PEP-CTERM system TPR-repeat protein PrsT [Aromatoleum sp.]
MNIRQLSGGIAALVLIAAISGCNRSDPASFIASAQSYLTKADYKAAIIELKNALAQAPNNPDARFLLARALLDGGDPVAAETEARKALELKYPADEVYPVLAWSLLRQGENKKLIGDVANRTLGGAIARAEVGTVVGLAHLALGQRKEARAAIEGALVAQPDNGHARVAGARLAMIEGDPTGAKKLVADTLAKDPKDIDALMLKADIERSQGGRDEAIATLERAVEIKPDALAVRYTLVSNLSRAGKLDRAGVHLDELKKVAPNDPRTLYSDALVAFARGNVAAARDAIQRAQQLAPDFLPAQYLSGVIDFQRGSYATAEESLRSVVAKVPDDDGARRILAETYLRRGRAAQALETLEPALRRSPDDPNLLRTAAEVYLGLNNPAKSADFYERANALDKGNVASRVRLAQVRLSTGDSGTAFKDLEGLAEANQSSREPDLALISAHLRRHEYDKALAAAVALETKQPKSPVSHNVKGVVYLAKRDFKNARASFEKALALDSDYVNAAFNLARLDIVERNIDGARKRYEQILAKDPKNEAALLALAELLALQKAPPTEIKAAIDRAIAANPTSVRARLTLISYNGQLKDWKAALAAAQAAQAALPDNPQVLEAVAATQQAAGESIQAVDTLRRAISLQPENPAPLMRLADIQARGKDYDGAIASLRSALNLQPDNPGVWVALANVYAQADRIDAGIADARRLQKERADRAVGFGLEGEIAARQSKWTETVAAYRAAYTRSPVAFVAIRFHSALASAGKREEAAAMAQKWLKDHPSDVTVRAYLGQQAIAQKDIRAAVAYLRPAVEIEPDNVVLLNNLAWALGELGDAKAIPYAERAYGLAPNSAATADTYGWLLVQRGDAVRGLELLRNAANLAPADADIRLHLAKALIKSGDKAAGMQELEALLKTEAPAPARAEAEKLLKSP